MAVDPKNVCFVGLGTTAVCYYRVMLPAKALGADWCGVYGGPEKLGWATGLVAKGTDGQPESRLPSLNEYEIVVLQQPAENGWVPAIKALQAQGVKVVYEVDDYLHGIKHQKDHGFKDKFGQEYLGRAELAMKAADAIFCSTDFIAENYRHRNRNVFVCPNGIDMNRYELTRPRRDTVNIGWAGATGHAEVLIPWLQQVAALMRMREDTCFVSIGQPFAEVFKQHFGEERAITIPFAAIEQYPAAMTMMDIALAPAGSGGWWRGKSDLRWLEAGALGIPIIAHPQNYPNIQDGVTGLHASNEMEMVEKLMLLLDNDDLRTAVGRNAQEVIRETRSFPKQAQEWQKALDAVKELKPGSGRKKKRR